MAQMNMIQAVNSAMDIMLERDQEVVVMGQDVGYFGGVFRCTDGLQVRHGEHRVLDSPISEGGIVATAIGMGVNGLRPVAEIQFADYIYPGFDQIASELARIRYRSDGTFTTPVTIRTPCGGGIRGGQTHSQSPEGIFAHVTGIKTVMPSNPYDAKGLLISAIESNDPVVFFEPKRIYNGPFEGDPDKPASGHIPGAICAGAKDALGPDGGFKSTEDLNALYASHGADGTQPVGVYCGSGNAATFELAGMYAAGLEAPLYVGSWSAWSADPARPVAKGPDRG